MALRGEGLMDGDEAGPSNSADSANIVYVLHPNCAIEEV
jgi:DNA replication licensing factor MCM6